MAPCLIVGDGDDSALPSEPQQQQPQQQPQQQRSVRFQLIELIEIAIVLGDSPSLSTGGPPMSLGWDPPVRRTQMDLDYYEKFRPKRRESRRELIIPGKKRTKFFLRCGYSLDEIEEAAAISLNYRKQMTITKLLEAPEKMKDAVKNRFASSQEPEPHNQTHRISRRHSMEPLRPPRREPEVDYPSLYDVVLTPDDLLLSAPTPTPPSIRVPMARRLSNVVGPETGLMRKFSREGMPIEPMPWITKSPTRLERRNSPTAECPTSPIPSIVLPEIYYTQQASSMEGALSQIPSRTFSPETEKRNNLRRHRSAPLSKYQELRMPVRTVSPIPPSAAKLEARRSHRTKGRGLSLDEMTGDDKHQLPSLPSRGERTTIPNVSTATTGRNQPPSIPSRGGRIAPTVSATNERNPPPSIPTRFGTLSLDDPQTYRNQPPSIPSRVDGRRASPNASATEKRNRPPSLPSRGGTSSLDDLFTEKNQPPSLPCRVGTLSLDDPPAERNQPPSLPTSRVGTFSMDVPPTEINQPPSFPGVPQRSISPSPDTSLSSPTRPCRRLSPPVMLLTEVPPSISS